MFFFSSSVLYLQTADVILLLVAQRTSSKLAGDFSFLGSVAAAQDCSNMSEKYMGKLDVTIRLEVIQKTALLGTARLLRRLLSL